MPIKTSALKKNLPSLVILGVGIWLCCSLVAYGNAWRLFGYTSDDVLRSGGGVYGGHVVSISSSGFLSNKDYFIQLDGAGGELMVPAVLLQNRWDHNPPVDFDVHRGDEVQIRTSGGKHVVLELIVLPKGQPRKTVMNYDISSMRYEQALSHAGDLCNSYMIKGVVALLLSVAAAGALYFRRRRAVVT